MAVDIEPSDHGGSVPLADPLVVAACPSAEMVVDPHMVAA